MDTTILKVNNNSEWAAAFLEYVKSLPFVEIELPKAKGKAIASPSVEILEEDEDGIPIAHRDFIMELSKEVKRGFAKRYFKAMEEKYAEK
ncbi:MAG: hypothetical protein D8H93_17690 [Capnocytophaga sp.]|nr:hypothetical protein [uncultured Capnocytophaga sp.]RKW11399.1 MAG: hypothetical protein D8H93_17690 [Capnocytophaga sp.]